MSRVSVFYSCPECGLVKVRCDVKARGPEDVLAWMNGVGVELSRDHDRRSPGCHPKELKNLMIPIEGVERIGDPYGLPPTEPEGT